MNNEYHQEYAGTFEVGVWRGMYRGSGWLLRRWILHPVYVMPMMTKKKKLYVAAASYIGDLAFLCVICRSSLARQKFVLSFFFSSSFSPQTAPSAR